MTTATDLRALHATLLVAAVAIAGAAAAVAGGDGDPAEGAAASPAGDLAPACLFLPADPQPRATPVARRVHATPPSTQTA